MVLSHQNMFPVAAETISNVIQGQNIDRFDTFLSAIPIPTTGGAAVTLSI